MRLRSGIALAILLFASLGAFYVSLVGQRHVIESSQNTRMMDRILVTLADFSLSFDAIKRDPTSQSAEQAMSRLRRGDRLGQLALDELVVAQVKHAHSEETRRILTQQTLNPLEEFSDVLDLARLSNSGGRSEDQMLRVATLGAELSRRLIPVFLRLTEAEAVASERVAKEQKIYSLVAILIGAFGIFVAARFVHLPMERFVISATAEIARNQRKAEAASEAKSVFLATMSHEIRTPLNGVMGLSELLQDSEADPDRRRMLDMIVSSGHSLLQVINDVLDLSKIEAGKITMDAQDFDVNTLCDEVVELFKAQAINKDIELDLEVLPAHGNWRIKAPSKAVRQVVLNLVNNAVKFTDHGKISVQLSYVEDTSLQLQNSERCVRIVVSDTGIGISEAALPKIFDQFAQADSSTTTRFGGTGLGLAIAKQLGNAMGGDVTVTSNVGVGSTFVLEFPALSQPAAARVRKQVSERLVFEGKVLVADDNRVNLLVAEKMLMKLGCTVKKATNGVEAVGMQRTWMPDLILMDIRMPEMDGLEATRMLRIDGAQSAAGEVPIIGLSANALKEHRDAGLASGMTGYLTKPLKKEALVSELKKHLRYTVFKVMEQKKCA